MGYEKTYTVNPVHVDFQGILDDLYYPFYMEECRHAYLKDVLSFDIEDAARNKINMVCFEYTIRFKKSLKADDSMKVTCTARAEGKFRLVFDQKILVGDTIHTEATFYVTCVPAAGGRPFLPQSIIDILSKAGS